MSARGRKGRFPLSPATPEDKSNAKPDEAYAVSSPSFRGGNIVDELKVDVSIFKSNSFIWKNSLKIFSCIFYGASPSSQKSLKRYLVVVSNYINARPDLFANITDPDEITFRHTNSFAAFVQNYKDRAQHVRFFNRVLKAISAPPNALVANPYSAAETPVKESVSNNVLKKALIRAKLDADVLRGRHGLFCSIRSQGRDPRQHGWDFPENRIWFLENVIGLEVPPWGELKANPEISPSLHKFAKNAGAPFVAKLGPIGTSLPRPGTKAHENGLLAHVRWFFPDPDDLVPFLALLLLRTPLNLTSIAEAQVGVDWHDPYQFNMSQKANEFVYVWFNKVRGRQDVFDSPQQVFTVSPITPRSFPFQVRKFLEEFTSGLRGELINQIARLATNPLADVDELKRLRSIQNDLFLYRSYKGINSLRQVTRFGQVPAFLSEGLRRYGISASAMRGNNLAYSYNFSGQNLAAITYLAMHRDRNLAILYARRDDAVKRTEELFRNIFEHSVALISIEMFDVDNLRLLLEAQSWSKEQVGNLLDDETLTRWGNRCASPLCPPPGFNRGTPPGQLCREQNCIDGCPNARWFRDSSPLIERRLAELRQSLTTRTFTAVTSSSLMSQISRLELILASSGKPK